ncbi:MAG: hypothetical protein P4L03_06505 [Terracidiphilus sp.]|nr:hypothetical protein [Terracidiphilus sp.]
MTRKSVATVALSLALFCGAALAMGQTASAAAPATATTEQTRQSAAATQERSFDSLPLQEQIAWGANLVLAAAGLLGILLAIVLLRKIERQTQATETAATAAADVAQAALAQAQALLNLDRPWVLISSEPSRTAENSFTVVATNRGRSPARIIVATHTARIAAEESQLPTEPDFNHAPAGNAFEPTTLLPGESLILRTFGREEMKQVCSEDGSLERVDTWKDRIYLYGRVVYRDPRAVGDRMEHETRWCYWYVNGRQHSGLVAAGAPAYNRHT